MTDLFEEAQLAKGVVELHDPGAYYIYEPTGAAILDGDGNLLGKGDSIPQAWIAARKTVERQQMAKLNEEATRREQACCDDSLWPLWKRVLGESFAWCLAVAAVAVFFYFAAEAFVWCLKLAEHNPFGMVCCVVPVVLVVGLWRDKGGK